MQQQKAALPDYKANLETIENYTTSILQLYTAALQDNQNAKETARAEYAALLKSKDKIIQELQSQVDKEQQMQIEATNTVNICIADNTQLKQDLTALQDKYNTDIADLRDKLADKDELNQVLTSSIADLKTKNSNTEAVAEEAKKVQKDYAELQRKYDSVVSERDTAQRNYTQLQADHKKELASLEQLKELEKQKDLFTLEKQYRDEIDRLQKEKQAEIDKYQSKYFDLLERQEKQQEKVKE
jgi:hypothetical protein